jgi:hypothetical protein
MLPNNSRSLKTRPDDPHKNGIGHDAPIGDVDEVVSVNHKLTLVPRPDLGDRKIHAIGPESTSEANGPPLPLWSVVFTNLMEGFVL